MWPVIAVTLLIISLVLFVMWRRAIGESDALRQELDAALEKLEPLAADEENLALHRQVVDVSYDALMVVDDGRIVRLMNAAARELFHPLDGAEIGDTVIAVTRYHELDDMIAELLRSGEAITEQIEYNSRPYRLQMKSYKQDDRTFVVVALDDVTELKRLGRARRDMVANVSHELRTPITTIRLLVDTLLRTDDRSTETANDMLQKIVAQTDDLHQLTQELLDLSMIESGRAEIVMRPVAVEAIIDDAVAHIWELAALNNLHIEKQVQGDVIALADALQIERVLSNLLHNAVKFTPPEGYIAIDATADQEWVKICVADSGEGVSPQERERIFERFYRGDQSRKGQGTGLGLAIAKHIVNAHGGDIWVSERQPTDREPRLRGACICFTLPVAG